MRKLITLILMIFIAQGARSSKTSNIEFDLPEGFNEEVFSDNRIIVMNDSAVAFIEFLPVSDIDKKKVLAIPDSDFVNLSDFRLVKANIDGKADVINQYYSPQQNRYARFYRYLHNDGMTYIYALNDKDDFRWADSIDSSYHHGARWYWIVLYIVVIVIWIYMTIMATEYFGKNWPRFIVTSFISLIFLIVGIITIGWTWSLLMVLLFMIIGIAWRHGYVVIPI